MRGAGNKFFVTLVSVVLAANARAAMELAFTGYMNSQHLARVSFSEYCSAPVSGSYLQIDPAARANLTAVTFTCSLK
jgi:hypothetical protein